jgi:DNA modification methylase
MSSPVMARKSYGLDWPCTQADQDLLIPCSRAYFVNSAVLWMPQPAVNRIHPTAKPVELIERALLNSSKASDVVSAKEAISAS